MGETARQEILARLRAAPRVAESVRPDVPPLKESSKGRDALIETFVQELAALGCTAYRVGAYEEALDRLTELVRSEGLTRIAASEDDVLARMDPAGWGKKNQVEVYTAAMFEKGEAFKRMVFEKAEAGLTGADYGLAESGTLCLVHGPAQPRLVSLAPPRHIAVVPADRIRPAYEDVLDEILGQRGDLPAQVTFITGPSMTADIQATLFTGMHGPKSVTVILVDQGEA